MTATYLSGSAALAPGAAKSVIKSAKSPSVLERVYQFLSVIQQRRAENEIAKFLASRGGRFSDSAEREIEQHFLNPRIF